MPTLNGVQTVKQHPEWYFRSGEFDTTELISLLVEEATRGGASTVEVHREGDWVKVAADVDWLAGDVAAFFAPLSYPEGGQNSSRIEVVLTAFCDAVVTATPKQVFEVASSPEGSLRSDELTALQPHAGRVVAFLPASDSRLPAASPPQAKLLPRPILRLVQGEGEARIAAAVGSFMVKQEQHG